MQTGCKNLKLQVAAVCNIPAAARRSAAPLLGRGAWAHASRSATRGSSAHKSGVVVSCSRPTPSPARGSASTPARHQPRLGSTRAARLRRALPPAAAAAPAHARYRPTACCSAAAAPARYATVWALALTTSFRPEASVGSSTCAATGAHKLQPAYAT
jgi:hypothetical protein